MVNGRVPCFCSASTTANPSASGIWTSRKTRSGFSRWMSEMAAFPSPHSATICRSGCCSSIWRRRPRARASSSLSNTRMDMISGNLLRLGSVGNSYLYGATATGCIFEHHGMVAVVELAKSPASVAQAYSFSRFKSSASKPNAVIADLHPHVVTVAPCGDTDQAGATPWGNAVADGVLHEGLQDKVGNECVECTRIDVGLNLQAIVKTHELNINVFL